MSCFVMSPESICTLACTLERTLNTSVVSPVCTISTNAVRDCEYSGVSILRAFSDCMCGSRYDARKLAEALWRINALAFAGRYDDPEVGDCPDFQEYGRGLFQPCECDENGALSWVYRFANLIDCWLYQTDEDATRSDPKRAALEAFSDALKRGIVQYDPRYNSQRWH